MSRENYKIVISGPVGSGKTTAIAALSDIEPVRTDACPSDGVVCLKETTTVALDYGSIELGGGLKVHLCGTPGQERFDFMWDILAEGALGLILLVNNAAPDPLGDLRRFLEAFSAFVGTAPLCVGVTHMDERPTPGIDAFRGVVEARVPGWIVPVFGVDARSRRDMSLLLMAMLGMIEPRLLTENLTATKAA